MHVVPVTITPAAIERNRPMKPLALAQHHVPTDEPLVTPEMAEKGNKHNAGVVRRAVSGSKRRQTAVAAAPDDNGMRALSDQLISDNGFVSALTAMMNPIPTAIDAPVNPQVPKRRRSSPVSPAIVPTPVAVPPGPPKNKCQGCVHGDLLELKVMEPSHIRHYLKSGQFLELEKCADCKGDIRSIHLTSPKTNLFYCDETLKGFHAPEADPIKKGLECRLILCSPCHALREVRYAPAHATDGARNRRTSRRGTNP